MSADTVCLDAGDIDGDQHREGLKSTKSNTHRRGAKNAENCRRENPFFYSIFPAIPLRLRASAVKPFAFQAVACAMRTICHCVRARGYAG
jgi:hypothetical protein